MPSFTHTLIAAGLAIGAAAQTPSDFMPGSLVKLGIAYPKINIEPAGTLVPSLDIVSQVPEVQVPASRLTGPDGQPRPNQKFMIFMIDMDVVQGSTATTLLHWFQPNLVAQMDNLVLLGNSTMVILKANTPQKRQAPPPAPGAPSGPTNTPPGLVGANAQAVYLGPGPPPGPPHRYVQLLFAQPDTFTFPACFNNILSPAGATTQDVSGRVGFDINQFLKATNITTRPIAGNYFRAQNPQPGSLTVNAARTALRNNNCPSASTPGPLVNRSLRYYQV